MACTCVDIQQGIEQGAHGQEQEQDAEGQGQVAEEQTGLGFKLRYQAQAELHHQRRHHLCQTVEHLVVQQVVEPVQGWLTRQQLDAVQYQVASHTPQHQGDDQQQAQAKAGLQHRVLIEGAEGCPHIEPNLLNIHALKSRS
ncbi:hypothetical protein D3C76_1219680 [compost metagenome]